MKFEAHAIAAKTSGVKAEDKMLSKMKSYIAILDH